jgi:hypothetical protein
VPGPSVCGMDTLDVADPDTAATCEEYWARVQSLRAELARLRPAAAGRREEVVPG